MSGFSFLAEESAILIYAGVLGLEMGLVYDLFRIFRRVWRCNFALTAAMDFLFWSFVKYFVTVGVFVLSRVGIVLAKVKKVLTNILKLTIIKLGKIFRKGDNYGKKSSISDKIS